MRFRHFGKKAIGWSAGTVLVAVLFAPGVALAQLPPVTPNPTVTPTPEHGGWTYLMAIGAIVIGIVAVVAIGAAYLRFSPKFFGRDEAPAARPPGARPPALARQAAALRQVPSAPTSAAASPASGAARAAAPASTAVAERPAPARTAVAERAAPVPTAGPSGEPAAQADAVSQAEVAAPEERPTAKTPAEVAPPAAETSTPAPAAASPAGGVALDQETFDRVLEEQLAKGVDRRVAEGRARAAAVVAARKKAAG